MATQTKIARHLDLSPRTLRDLTDRGLIPASADLDEMRVAYIRHLRARAAGHTSGEDGLDLAGERARLAAEQADAQAMKNAVSRGELVSAVEIEFAGAALLRGVRDRLLAVPSKVAVDCAAESEPAVVEALIAAAQHEALAEIAAVEIRELPARAAKARPA